MQTLFKTGVDPEDENIFSVFKGVNPKTQVLPPEDLNIYAVNNNIPIEENSYTKETFNSMPLDKNGNDIFRSFNVLENNGTVNTKLNPTTTMTMTMQPNVIISEINDSPISEDRKDLAIKLAKRESGFDPYVTNKYGYFGLYQLGKMALQDVGMSLEDVQSSIPNQHKAFFKLVDLNEKRLAPIIENYAGKIKNDIKITKNGILAAAHLLGAATVKDWFNGTKNTKLAQNGFKDANGTKLESYLKLFS